MHRESGTLGLQEVPHASLPLEQRVACWRVVAELPAGHNQHALQLGGTPGAWRR